MPLPNNRHQLQVNNNTAMTSQTRKITTMTQTLMTMTMRADTMHQVQLASEDIPILNCHHFPLTIRNQWQALMSV